MNKKATELKFANQKHEGGPGTCMYSCSLNAGKILFYQKFCFNFLNDILTGQIYRTTL